MNFGHCILEVNVRCLREAAGRSRREADIADRGLVGLTWAGERTFMHLISNDRNLRI